MGRVRSGLLPVVVLSIAMVSLLSRPAAAGDEASVSGTLTANGTTVQLPYVYVYALDEGFYDPADPTWKILFVEHPVEERDVDETVWDSAYVELGVTRTAEFGEGEPTLQVYSQNIKLSADSGGNLSGGSYPAIEITTAGPDRFAGRVWHAEPQEFFDDVFQYDLTFDAPLSDPDAPIGDLLPAGGGDPGAAYAAWVAAIHSGDLEQIRRLVPPDMASELDSEEARDSLEFMAALTPTDITVLGGSSDGETAVLQVEGMMDGKQVSGEVTLQKVSGVWMATSSSW